MSLAKKFFIQRGEEMQGVGGRLTLVHVTEVGLGLSPASCHEPHQKPCPWHLNAQVLRAT